jgi:hypothetical protein
VSVLPNAGPNDVDHEAQVATAPVLKCAAISSRHGRSTDPKLRDRSRVAQGFQLAVAAYNLIRIPKLLMPERLA